MYGCMEPMYTILININIMIKSLHNNSQVQQSDISIYINILTSSQDPVPRCALLSENNIPCGVGKLYVLLN